jgi:magnesium chelatase subunit D
MQLLPFPALVGLEPAQQALLLLAVEPRLQGIVLSAPVGTGKSTLVRGLRTLLEALDPVPFVEIPTHVDAENLLGGVDLKRTLAEGALATRPGLLARAHGGFVHVDGIHLMEEGSVHPMLAALDEGELRVEREGVSLRAPARFRLIGSYDPAEGAPRQALLDRVGLLVSIPGHSTEAERTAVVDRNLNPDFEHWAWEEEGLRGVIAEARAILPDVVLSSQDLRRLSSLALAFGVEGHRVDLFAAWAARAAAALDLRDAVEEEDLEVATRFVILPRATRIPASGDASAEPPPPPPPSPQPPPSPPGDASAEPPGGPLDTDSLDADPLDADPPDADRPDADPPDPDTRDPDPPDPDPSDVQPERPESALPSEGAPDQILHALEADLPVELDALAFRVKGKRSRAGSRGAMAGTRGRHVRSVPGDPGTARLDPLATLRAAAPWQGIRERTPGGPIRFRSEDLRVKQYRSKAGALFIIAVDASGSMALHRMRQAKGAVHALLQKAYVKRDRVALLAFRGPGAEVLMPPSQSVELARRALDVLPTGGGTPLTDALLKADVIAAQARARGIHQSVLLLLTDGRGNVPVKAGSEARAELEQVARGFVDSPLRIVVVDTQKSYLSRGEARALAGWLGAGYAYLPGASGEAIASLATDFAEHGP